MVTKEVMKAREALAGYIEAACEQVRLHAVAPESSAARVLADIGLRYVRDKGKGGLWEMLESAEVTGSGGAFRLMTGPPLAEVIRPMQERAAVWENDRTDVLTSLVKAGDAGGGASADDVELVHMIASASTARDSLEKVTAQIDYLEKWAKTEVPHVQKIMEEEDLSESLPSRRKQWEQAKAKALEAQKELGAKEQAAQTARIFRREKAKEKASEARSAAALALQQLIEAEVLLEKAEKLERKRAEDAAKVKAVRDMVEESLRALHVEHDRLLKLVEAPTYKEKEIRAVLRVQQQAKELEKIADEIEQVALKASSSKNVQEEEPHRVQAAKLEKVAGAQMHKITELVQEAQKAGQQAAAKTPGSAAVRWSKTAQETAQRIKVSRQKASRLKSQELLEEFQRKHSNTAPSPKHDSPLQSPMD